MATRTAIPSTNVSNPLLSAGRLQSMGTAQDAAAAMTAGGAVAKTLVLLVIVSIAGAFSWSLLDAENPAAIWWLIGASVVAFVIALVIVFRGVSPILAMLYAATEGIVLGFVSSLFATAYDGIVVQAILLTVATMFGMLFLYMTGMVKVTQRLRSVILIATLGVVIFLVAQLVLSFFVPSLILVWNTGALGIAIAAVIVVIAALNLLLDFDFITQGVEHQLPRRAEWYAAFGLMVTLIWLYLSILRLLALTRR